MKTKIYKIILFTLISINGFTQIPLIDFTVNKEWYERINTFDYRTDKIDCHTSILTISDSVLLDNKTYFPVLYDGIFNKNNYQDYLRVEGNKIYHRKISYYDTEYLLYDFGLQKGDTFTYYTRKYVIEQIDSVKFQDNILRKRYLLVNKAHEYETDSTLTVDSTDFNWRDYWVEGIGALEGGLLYHNREMRGVSYNFTCYFENGIRLYKNPKWDTCYYTCDETAVQKDADKFFSISPNPATTKLFIYSTFFPINNLELLNLQGQTVLREKRNDWEKRNRCECD